MDGLEDIKEYINGLNIQLDNLENYLGPLTDKPLNEKVSSNLPPIQQAEIYSNYAYALVAILFSYLKTLGTDTSNHKIMGELQRVKSYMNKVKQMKNHNQPITSNSRVDKEAANRFIKHALAGNSQGLEPTISSLNFTGVHKRFSDSDNATNGLETSSVIGSENDNESGQKKRRKSKKSQGKVSKNYDSVEKKKKKKKRKETTN